MATYLLTWNPNRWEWDDISDCIAEVRHSGRVERRWSIGATRRIVPGDRVFLMRLGREPRGIIASGTVTRAPFEDEHWDPDASSRSAWYIRAEFDGLIDAEEQPDAVLSRSTLMDVIPQKHGWAPQASGVSIPGDIAEQLKLLWGQRLSGPIEHPRNLAPLDGDEGERRFSISVPDDREIALAAIRQRRGQASFRQTLLERYNQTCMVTGCRLVDVLEAAHIVPYRGSQHHHPENGLLLRSDIHTLFDLYLLSVHPDTLEVHTARRLRNTEYSLYDGSPLAVTQENQPSSDALRHHWRRFEQHEA